ncbi:MAG: hypothetical protein ABEJ07_05775 [Candidatus Nanohaloarchaea archaeon]
MNLVDETLPGEARSYLEQLQGVEAEYETKFAIDQHYTDFYDEMRDAARTVQEEIKAAHAMKEISESPVDTPTGLMFPVEKLLEAEFELQTTSLQAPPEEEEEARDILKP